MAKLFNNIRKKLINDKPSATRTANYLKYAFGEIVLVVIGILIALQINNWNQLQKENKNETLSLTNLLLDLEEQTNLLDDYIKYESTYEENGVYVLNYYAKNNTFIQIDSIFPKLNSLTERRTFNPIKTTFRELNSTGNIGHIRNEIIKRNIIRYYNDLERVSLIISNNNINLVDGIFNSVILKYSVTLPSVFNDSFLYKMSNSISDLKSLKELHSTSEKMLLNPENALNLFNVLALRTKIAYFHKKYYLQLKEETTKLINEINEELNKE